MAIPKFNEVLYKVSGLERHRHDDDCCSYICTIDATTYGIDITVTYTDVYVCPEQYTIILRHSSAPDDYTSGNLSAFNTLDESVRDEVFRRLVWRDKRLNWIAHKIDPKHWKDSPRSIMERYGDVLDNDRNKQSPLGGEQ